MNGLLNFRRPVSLGMAATLLAIVFARPAESHGAGAKDKPRTAELSPKKQRELTRLLSDFRRTHIRSRRDGIARRLFALGKPGANGLLAEVNRELAAVMTRYEAAFAKRAASLVKSRLNKAKPDAIQALRNKVLSLQKRPDLSKALITREADPVLVQLRTWLALDRTAVLKRAPRSMMDRRKQLQAVGRYWDLCVQQLAGPQPTKKKPIRKRRRRRKPKTKPPGFEDYLRGRERITAQVAASATARDRSVLAANAGLAGQLDPQEARNILHCNLTRNLLGLPVLAIDLKLTATARDHSRDMQRLKFFSHTSPVPGKRSFFDRARRFGVRASSENIYMGRTDGLIAHTGWFHSPGHHRNILGRHTRIGVGRSGVYFTQMFGR